MILTPGTGFGPKVDPKNLGVDSVGPEECPMSSAANYVAVITGAVRLLLGFGWNDVYLMSGENAKKTDSEFMIEKGWKDLITMCSFLVGFGSRIGGGNVFLFWNFHPGI